MRSNWFRPSRRKALRAVALAGGAVLCNALDAVAQDKPAAKEKPKAVLKKYPKEKVGYRDQPYEGRTCAKCVLYAGDGNCAIVEGTVSQDGWCTQWTPATMGKADGLSVT
jgi:hypothetical protein